MNKRDRILSMAAVSLLTAVFSASACAATPLAIPAGVPAMPFPPDVKPRAEMSFKLTLVGSEGKRKEIKLKTREGYAVTYGDLNRRSYIEAVENGSAGPIIRPATLQTGLTVYAEPGRINDNGQVTVRFKVEDSSLESLHDVTVDGSTVQLPNIQTAALDQSILMKSGVPVHLNAIRRGDKEAWTVEAEIDFDSTASLSSQSVMEGVESVASNGSPCTANGLMSFNGVLMFCEGGKWTAQDIASLARQTAALPESLYGGAFVKPARP